MEKKDNPKKNKPNPAMVIVFLFFAALTVWFFYTDQPIAEIIFPFLSFMFLRRTLDF